MQKVDLPWDPLPLDCQPLMPETDAQDLCTVSVEKRIREDETWRLQKTLQDLLFRFQDWLRSAEAMASSPNSSQPSYASSKKELQKFEALQRQVSDKLLPLEALNRQYHQLVRRGTICPQLRSRVQEHFVTQWEEFESKRETLQLWLMELDLRLTDVFEDEWVSDRDSDLESDCFSVDSLQLDDGDVGQPHSPLDPLCQSTPKKALLQHHKRTAPNIGRTMDLEWDPSVDVGVDHLEEPHRKGRSSRWMSSFLPLRYGSQEDFMDAGICIPIPPSAKGKFPVPSPITGHRAKQHKPQQRTKKKAKPALISPPGLVSNGQISKEKQLDFQTAEIAITTKKGCDPPSWLNLPFQSQQLPKSLPIWNRLMIFFLLALLLVFLFWANPSSLSLSEPTCLQANGYAKSFHLMLKYNGPPPT
ncbi:hypothetical protein JD844_005980 [Phrynosoma platyrhinos]|uniref:KASH domain-containing protein n=1 Tax=Phrynosoma platyrhinos TaxID=52577 RepID=A0ABQ7TQB1_PHRPL|nr:hypothetical protein JD844_005980 [Phrynosoma platyrhinos]